VLDKLPKRQAAGTALLRQIVWAILTRPQLSQGII